MDAPKQWTPDLPAHMKLSAYATKPTRFTVFIRTFLPWQFVRFIILNLKIVLMTRRNEHI